MTTQNKITAVEANDKPNQSNTQW